MKKILVACGTGVATSTVVIDTIKNKLADKGMQVELYQCRTSEIGSQIDAVQPDIVVCTSEVKIDTHVPVFNGLPFLTGIGDDEAIQEMVEILKK